jgi:hypothetical protein
MDKAGREITRDYDNSFFGFLPLYSIGKFGVDG